MAVKILKIITIPLILYQGRSIERRTDEVYKSDKICKTKMPLMHVQVLQIFTKYFILYLIYSKTDITPLEQLVTLRS